MPVWVAFVVINWSLLIAHIYLKVGSINTNGIQNLLI